MAFHNITGLQDSGGAERPLGWTGPGRAFGKRASPGQVPEYGDRVNWPLALAGRPEGRPPAGAGHRAWPGHWGQPAFGIGQASAFRPERAGVRDRYHVGQACFQAPDNGRDRASRL